MKNIHEFMNTTIDLHGYGAREAETIIGDFVDFWQIHKKETKQQLTVITGWGRHSPNNIPVLKPMFLDMMRKRGIRVYQRNKGCFIIEI